jgi:hypothetical protein
MPHRHAILPTPLAADVLGAHPLYEVRYCARGDDVREPIAADPTVG